ncbi:MAG TPA: thioredoxin-disulfide reductase [Candidatus Acidoferrales bacterium]|nr:thioredoxin-disulfide reductase [Candidatus Acidoferrales bacterium]
MYDVIILGSGPAGLTAAIYTTRASLKTLVIAGEKWGGQLMLTTEVENFPGFPEGIQGPDLMANMRKQAERFGAEFVDENFKQGDFNKTPFIVTAADKTYEGKSVIIATGADTKWLGVPGESERIGRGVSSCAPCDAPFFRNKNVIVVGGGDSAMEEALVLTRFAEHVTVIYRGDTLRASEVMQQRAFANEKISFIFNTVIEEIKGEQKVEKVLLKTNCTDGSIIVKPGEHMGTTTVDKVGGTEIKRDDNMMTWEMPTDGIFVAIGHIPNSKVFSGIDVDEKGFIIVHEHTKTNKEGVFVAGDVHDRQYMQAVTAAGFGCAAALEAERWLEAQE